MRVILLPLLAFLGWSGTIAGQNCMAAFGFGETGLTIEFMDQSTVAAGDQIVAWSWNFDDGTGSSQQNPTHTFPEADRYDVELTITTQNGCSSNIEVRIETCVLSTSYTLGQCDANGNISVSITINDVYDNADEIYVLLDNVEVPGSPFDIEADEPVGLNLQVPGDGLEHSLTILSDDIETCGTEIFFTVPDCSSDCFLNSLLVAPTGGTTHTVNVGGDFFAPQQITIDVGDVVRWNWIDGGHTTTSDATSGPDSWNSGLRGNGATFDFNITNPGLHRYYCIPHGGPNGSGMAGQIVANCPPGGNFTLDVTFNTTQNNPQGYNLLLDGVVQPGSPFTYAGTGPQSTQLALPGDGQLHTIVIRDVADPSCDLERTYQAPDCGAAPTCQLSVTAAEDGGCSAANTVPVTLMINAVNAGASGYRLRIDGTLAGTFPYGGGGNTTQTVNVAGDGQSHTILVEDVDDPTCSATTTVVTTDCSIPCSLTNLTAGTGGGTIHQVEVRDFDFFPAQLTIAAGDRVEWVWTGQVAHTATSDATSGLDSWESGLLNTGATYLSPVLSAGVHPYYCAPHGAPGGVGMSGTLTVQADCDNGNVAVNVSFSNAGTGVNGYRVSVDGQVAGTFNYVAGGSQSAAVLVPGDGQSHTIVVSDVDDASCAASTTITTANCNAPTCQLSNVSAQENGGCQGDQTVPVLLSFNSTGGSPAGYRLRLDGVLLGTFPYGSGTTTRTVNVAGDGQSHTLLVEDIDDPSCSATATVVTTDCSIPCSLTNLTAGTGGGTIHQVEVRDFDFFPAQLTIAAGDRVEWVWTGQVAHTATSDATSGPDSWESGLLNTGATYLSPVLSAGVHPYYCAPHGAPGGVGMSGTLTVQADCDNGNVAVNVSFSNAGTGVNGYRVSVDGQVAGTFNYVAGGSQSASVLVPGDGQSHTIVVSDVDDAGCAISTIITTADCNAPTCQLSNVSAQESGGCQGDQTVPVLLSFNSTGGSPSGYRLRLDGVLLGTFPYGSGTTTRTVDIAGDGQSHTLLVEDVNDPNCSATTTVVTTDCSIPCSLTNLTAGTGGGTIHQVEVRDFDFFPAQLTIAAGDRVEWIWTGQVAHTATSDATSGPDSWESGLLNTGATYLSPVLSAGVHPYYCAPHGAPGGVGMSGTLTVQADCDNGNVAVNVSFSNAGTGVNGYRVSVDGQVAGTFNYVAGGSQSASVLVPGDGQSHTIVVSDVDDASCAVSTTITTADCNAPTCQLSNVSAQENGGCQGDQTVPVLLSFNSTGGSPSGYRLRLDGVLLGTFPYGSGTTTRTVDVAGDGQSHTLLVEDVDDPSCSATTTVVTTDCSIPCSLTNLTAGTGGGTIHQVEVRDFDFFPAQLTIAAGDRVEWVWTGQVAHTATSDATSGPDSWESGLLNTGATYLSPVLSAGVHPYYCAPHGAPGGVGMSGTLTVQADCDNGNVAVNVSFSNAGTGVNGYRVSVDGQVAGTFNYVAGGSQSASVLVPGDGQSHTIVVSDVDDASCAVSTTITTADCNAPTCQLSNVSAQENGGCQGDQTVPVLLSFNSTGGSPSGYRLRLDGVLLGTFPYGSGTTTRTVDVAGDGQSHTLLVEDVDDPSCSATTTVVTTDCSIPCSLTNLTAGTGGGTIHQVEVRDFDFFPAQLTIAAGDRVEWVWTGQVAHTATSDATSGPDSWESGLLNTGATYLSPVLSAGVHPYYCAPHGAPGGVGMSGTLTVQADCDNGNVAVNVSFSNAGTGVNGYRVSVDGQVAGTFNYVAGGSQSASVLVPGDGQSHTIVVSDVDDASCAVSTTITTADCNAPTCQLSNVSAQENGGCQGDQTVPVLLSFNSTGGSPSGYRLRLDGVLLGTFPYGSGTTTRTVDVAGDGQSHTLLVEDVDDPSCSATTTVVTTDCSIPCSLTNLTAGTGGGTIHQVEVRDFDFFPAQLTIAAGDRVEWVWTGQVAHTATSDATSGPDSWESGLLNTGATYLSPVFSAGVHPYYCAPHGAPGGVGMSGTLTVQADCDNGQVALNINFSNVGTGANGYVIQYDGQPIDTLMYVAGGNQSATVLVPGDGQTHDLSVSDLDNASCSVSTSVSIPDCNASGCLLSNFNVEETGGCQGDQMIPVLLSFNSTGGSPSGYALRLDGTVVDTFPYGSGSMTTQVYEVSGDGLQHTFALEDLDNPFCTAVAQLVTTDCSQACALTNGSLEILTEGSAPLKHFIDVEDFSFDPLNLTLNAGDTACWVWTGQVPHTVTSDATTGIDSWDSGLLGNGSQFYTIIDEAGTHPYYCIPHGTPGGVGMAATINALPVNNSLCNEDGEVNVRLTFTAESPAGTGFRVLLDGDQLYQGEYGTPQTVVDLLLPGNGEVQTLAVIDLQDPDCALTLSAEIPLCTPPDTCALELATFTGACSADGRVAVTIAVSGLSAIPAAYRLFIDGVLQSSTVTLSSQDSLHTFLWPGLGQAILVELESVDSPTCAGARSVELQQCGLECAIYDLAVESGNHRYTVQVEDFTFTPNVLNLLVGDTVNFVWTGQIPHTATSDAISGIDSWDSGLLNNGASFEVVILSEGDHPYYCVPHGGPGGIGMAGLIRAALPCTPDGTFTTTATFGVYGGAPSGFRAFLDGNLLEDSILYNQTNGLNTYSFSLPGDGALHQLTLQDRESNICAATTVFTAEDCSPPDPCLIDNLQAALAEPSVQIVEVRDFDFFPQNVTINVGDTIRFVWTGQIPHTATSDATSGPNSWESGLLGNGATYDVVIDTAGFFPYYCIPHGGPGGIGMAGSVTVRQDCAPDGLRNLFLSFDAGSGRSEQFRIFVDGEEMDASPFNYAPGEGQSMSLQIMGDLSPHLIVVSDVETEQCTDSVYILVPPCLIGCAAVMADFDHTSDGNTVTFTDQTQGTVNSWLWGFGDGSTSHEANPVHEYDAPGTYSVCLLVQDSVLNCNAAVCRSITVGPVSTTDITGNTSAIKIYPNPVSGSEAELTFMVVDGPQGRVTNIRSRLLSMDGRLNQTIHLRREGTVLAVSTARLPAGFYTLLLVEDDRVYIGKLVVH